MGVLPPDHAKLVPPVAVTQMEVVIQVSTVVPLLLVIPAAGGVIFCVSVMLEIAVQPFDPVTVTV